MTGQEIGSQAELQAKINELLSQRSKQFAEQEASLSKQLKLMLGLKEAAEGTSKGVESASRRLEEVAKSEEKVAQSTEKAAGAQKNFTAEIKKAADESEELNKRLEMAAGIASAFGDSLQGAASSTIGLIKAGGNLIGTLMNVGQTILSLPFKLWDAFVEQSTTLGAGSTELAQAYEEVRKQFGDLASGSGKQVVDMYKNLKSSGAEAREMGRSLGKVFGYGPEGQAAMLKFTAEMAGSLGSMMGEVMQQIGKDMLNVTYAIKGMGISNEEAGKAMLFFKNSGQNAGKMLQEMGTTAAMMAKQTGFNIKTLSKAMVETTQVFPQFAKQGVGAMAKVAHYTHNLGIEVKDLQGVFEKFDSFDQAAESASQLSQAFGVQVDAMKMVKEQDPTKRIESLRNAFKAAGKDINNMTTAERKLAEATTGLSGAAFEAALGEGNKKKQLSESEKASQAATRAAKDQANAMKQLAKSIEKIIPPASTSTFKGFFDAFSQGFADGMMKSQNLRGVFRDLQRTFRQVYYIGKDLGKMFFEVFPGMEKMAKGFREIFNPQKFAQLRIKVKEIFTQFFADLSTDPKAGFEKFIEKMKKAFSNIFGGTGDSGLAKMKEGFSKFTKVMGVILAEAFAKIAQLALEGIRNLIDLIANPKKLVEPAKTAGGFAANMFGPLVEKIKELGPKLLSALLDLGKAIFVKLQPLIEKVATVLSTFFAVKFAMNLAISLVGALAKAGIQALMTKALTPPVAQSAADTARARTRSAPPRDAAGRFTSARGVEGQKGFIKALADIPLKDIGMATIKLIALAAMATVGLVAFVAGMTLVVAAAGGAANLLKMGIALAPMAVVIGIVGGIVWVLSKVDPMAAVKATLVLGLIGVLLLALATLASGTIPMFDGISVGSVAKFAVVTAALVGAILLLSVPVALIAAVSKIPGMDPGSIAIATLIIGLIGLVVVALGAIAALALGGLAQILNEDTAKRMILIAQAVGEFADAMSTIGTALLKFGLLALNPFALFAGMGAMLVITTVMTKQIPDMVKGILNAMSGMNADEVKTKVGVMKDLMVALDPLVKIAVSINEMVTEMADEDIDDKGISKVLNDMKGAFDSILTSMSTFVTTLITSAAGLDPAGVESAKAIGPVLGSVGTLIGALMGPMTKIIEGSRDTGAITGKLEEIDPKLLEKNLKSMTDTMTALIEPMKKMLGKDGPIGALIQMLKANPIKEDEVKGLSALADVMGEVVGAVKFFIDAFTETAKQEKGGPPAKMGMIKGLGDSLKEIRTALFDKDKGFMTGIVQDLLDPVKFPIDVSKADEIKKKAELIGVLLTPLKTLTEIVKDLPTAPPAEGKQAQGFFTAIKSALFGEDGNSDTLKVLLQKLAAAMTGSINDSQLKKLAAVKPFFETLSAMSSSLNQLGEKKIDWAPIDFNLRNFATALQPGYSLRDFIDSIKDDNPLVSKIKTLENFSKGLSKVKTILDDLQHITEVKASLGVDGDLAKLGQDVVAFAAGVSTANGQLKNVSELKHVVKDIGKLGKIQVNHNLPNVKMEVNVSLDTKAIGQSIINVDVSKDNKMRRIALVERNANQVVGK